MQYMYKTGGDPLLLLDEGLCTFETFANFQGFFDKHGKLLLLEVAMKPRIISCDYDFFEFMLGGQKVLNKSTVYTYLMNWLGTGLLTSDGPKWKKRRRLLTPAFHFSILEQFVDTFETQGKVLIRKLESLVDKDIDIYKYITLYALDVICETAMGITVNAQEDSESDYVRYVKEVCRIVAIRPHTIFKSSQLLYPLSKDFFREQQAVRHLHSVTYSVIDSRMKKLEQELAMSEAKRQENEATGIKRKMAFLDILLRSTIDGQPLSREDIREEVDTFMFEGHDTTASAISFCVFQVATHPDVQEKILEEQISIFGDDFNRNATLNDLQEMRYLECVVKETLRLFPSVPFIGRRTNEDTMYKGNLIPKDVNITLCIYHMMRDPEQYPNPNEFDPSRFEYNDGKKPYSFVPFSAGPRNCIGQKFAMNEVKSIVSKLVRNYKLLPTNPEHKLKLVAEAVMKSKNGVKIRLARREKPT
ncbi:unnamed protein product [Acanthoscelides obtectus]|uniref:Cytochrome P450 n=1 Tax=Acanthoscelides obtectus TaxID=200917 RepID=A0A9P0JKD0_ACAOB|nr:unnamed protein product [Acanthoscelides obtectus]CAK1634821.1 Cytochrome P450 4d2 [Acanthoscelides obtectus]